MSKIRSSLLLITALMLQSNVQAKMLDHQYFQNDLTYNNNPIAAKCFDLLGSNETKINLANCSQANDEENEVNQTLAKKGYYGCDIKSKEPLFRPIYHYYRAFNAADETYFIESISSGGGSGIFSTLSLVKRTSKNTLSIKFITGGDRCNGGIKSVNSEHKLLRLSVNLTPASLIRLSERIYPDKTRDKFDDCAACCIGTANYDLDASGKKSLRSVTLQKSTIGTEQDCLSKLLKNIPATNDTIILTKVQLKRFIARVARACINN